MTLLRGFVASSMIMVLVVAAMADESPSLTFKVGDDAPTLTVTIEDGLVEITDADRERTWNIPFDEEMVSPVGGSLALFSAIDMNFDGYLDLQVLASRGSHNVYYDCYLWNAQRDSFQKDRNLEKIANPIFDGARERVTSFCHVSATDHSEAEYSWIEGNLTRLWHRGLSYDDKTERFIIVEERHFTESQIERHLAGLPAIDDRTASQIHSAARVLLDSDIASEGRLHGEALTEGKEVGAWLFDLENGEVACFEVALDGSLYLNRGTSEGTFLIEFGEEITLGERVY